MSPLERFEDLLTRLEYLESRLAALLPGPPQPEFYTVEEFARLTGRTPFTVREWARLQRIQATKHKSGRGAYLRWVISHKELQRYRREGLLPASHLTDSAHQG